MKVKLGRRVWSEHVARGVIAVLASPSLVGCGPGSEAESLEEPVGYSSEEFSEANCKIATADFTNIDFQGQSRDFVDMSPVTYNNAKCGKARVYRLRDPFIRETQSGKAFPSLRALYGESGPNNKADCEATWSGIQVYTDFGSTDAGQGTTWTELGTTVRTYGRWRDNRCYRLPAMVNIPSHQVDATHPPWRYQVAATARHADGTTAKVAVQQGACGNIGQMACVNLYCFEGAATGGSPTGGTRCAPIETRTIQCPSQLAGTVSAVQALTISNTGDWWHAAHVHNGGLFGLNYTTAIAAPTAYNGFQFGVVHSGIVHGTFDIGDRDDDFRDHGIDSRLSKNWDAIALGLRTTPWTCRLKSTTNPWLVAEDALIGLGIAAAGTAAVFFFGSLRCGDAYRYVDPSTGEVSLRSDCS